MGHHGGYVTQNHSLPDAYYVIHDFLRRLGNFPLLYCLCVESQQACNRLAIVKATASHAIEAKTDGRCFHTQCHNIRSWIRSPQA
jgi:hypothetical protein